MALPLMDDNAYIFPTPHDYKPVLRDVSVKIPASRSISSSRQNALTMESPEILSSTCPFSAPNTF